jgi:hypothetical protein
VWIDGKEVGTTPYRAKILIGSHEVELRHETYGLARKTMVIQEKKITTVQLTMDRNLSVRLRARDAIEKGAIPGACNKLGGGFEPSLISLVDYSISPIGLAIFASHSPGNNGGIWTGYIFTKLSFYAALGLGIYGVVSHHDDKNSTEFKAGIAGIVVGAIGQASSNFVFLPKIKDRYIEACVMKHLGGKTSCAPAQEEPSGLTLAPFIAPGPDGDAHWGVSMGGGF